MNITVEEAFKILIIVLLSGLIGYNREKSGMLVGIRTHILVGLSAVLLQITSLHFWASGSLAGDPSRLGGQMLTGIGFLGAGSILKDNKNIRGLTTAASIFFVACIGLAVGFGYYVVAIVVTIIGYLFLSDALRLKKYIKNKQKTKPLNFVIGYEESKNIDVRDIISVLTDLDIEIISIDLKKKGSETLVYLKLKSIDELTPTDIIAEISQINNLTRIQQT